MKSKQFIFILLIGYLITGYVPNFVAIDKMATQYFYLAILNFIGLSFFVFSKKEMVFLNRYSFITFVCFTFWSLFSFPYAFNKEEVFLYGSKFLIFFTSILVIQSTLKELDLKNKNFVLIIISMLLVEIIWINSIFFERFNIAGGRDMGLRAFTGNINITGIALLLKIPFLIYGVNEFKGMIKKVLVIIFPFAIFTVLLMGSRLTNLLVICLIIGFTFYYVVSKGSIIKGKTVIIFGISTLIAVFTNNFIFEKSSINVIERSTNIATKSTDQRIRFYKQALNHIIQNPLFGTGAGNWKIQSLIYDNEYLTDYIVPYQVHNDFLQTAAELGIVGFFLRFSLYFIILFFLFKNLKNILIGDNLLLYLLAPFLIFLIDSFFNFPQDRPIMLITTQVIISVIFLNIKGRTFFKSYNVKKPVIIILLLLSVPLIYLTQIVYKSFVNQNHLIVGMIQDSYYLSEDEVYDINSKFPSIGATTIPMETYKANYLFNKGIMIDSMFDMVDVGTSKNPYIYSGLPVKAVFHLRKENLDSAKFYAEKAFKAISDNKVHFNLYTDILAATKDTLGLKEAYNYLKKPTRPEFTRKYLTHMNSIKDNLNTEDSTLIEELYNKKGISELGDVLKIINQVGKKNVFDGIEAAEEAEGFYILKNYKYAARLFEKAIKLNPREIAYYDNAANSYMKLGNNQKAITILLKAIDFLETTGKTEYLLSILYYDEGEKEKSCYFLNKAKNKNFQYPNGLETIFCQKEYY